MKYNAFDLWEYPYQIKWLFYFFHLWSYDKKYCRDFLIYKIKCWLAYKFGLREKKRMVLLGD